MRKSILSNLSNFQLRLFTGIMGVLLLITTVSLGQWFYYSIFLGICVLTMLEFYKLLGLEGNIPLKFYGTMNGALIYTISFLVEEGIVTNYLYLIIYPITALIFIIKLYKSKDDNPIVNTALTFLGIIYVALPFSLFHVGVYAVGDEYHYQIPLGCLLLVWASDTGAYFAGRLFGRKLLFERISPKKTWEGSVGGAILCFIVAFFMSYYFNILPWYDWAFTAGIIVVAGSYGDLIESLFKRSLKIKDSGRLLPGHGGFLDRFDGLLLAMPFIAAFLKLMT